MVHKRVNDHNHGPDAAKTEAIKVKAALKQKAGENPELPPQAILGEVLQSASDSAISQLLSKRHIKRTLRGQCRKALGLPDEPEGEEFQIIPDEWKEVEGRHFLLYDSREEKPKPK